MTNNDLQNGIQKTKDGATQTLLKLGEGELGCSGRIDNSSSTCGTHYVIYVTNL